MKTTSEKAFEQFLAENNLPFQRIEEQDSPRPDYAVQIGDLKVMFEVKELAEDENYGVADPSKPDIRSFSRTIGEHVRKKIKAGRKQARHATAQQIPAVLLIYNNIDPTFWFGTEDHDFITAMYGEYTVALDRSSGTIVDAFHGRNRSLRQGWNTEFSAIGRLATVTGKLTVKLFENVFAAVRIPYEKLPTSFDVLRFQLDYTTQRNRPRRTNITEWIIWSLICVGVALASVRIIGGIVSRLTVDSSKGKE